MEGERSISAAIAFLGRQQMTATAMQFAIMALNEPRLKDQTVQALRDLADTAESDCVGIEALGASYADQLRRYALILETGEDPDGQPQPFRFTIIDGGKRD